VRHLVKVMPGMEGILFFLRKTLKETVVTVDTCLVQGLFNIMSALLKKYERKVGPGAISLYSCPKKFREYPENGQNFQKTPKFPRKCPKFPALCRNSQFAYYAESDAGIFRLALTQGGAGRADARGDRGGAAVRTAHVDILTDLVGRRLVHGPRPRQDGRLPPQEGGRGRVRRAHAPDRQGQGLPDMTKCVKSFRHLATSTTKSSKWSVLIG
jgi:hypothetical protein